MDLNKLEVALKYVQDYTEMDMYEALAKIRKIKEDYFKKNPTASYLSNIDIDIVEI